MPSDHENASAPAIIDRGDSARMSNDDLSLSFTYSNGYGRWLYTCRRRA